MKYKIAVIILFLFATAASQTFAQSITGVWYTPLRNKLLAITVSKDSIVITKCSFDNPKQDYGYNEAYKVEKKIKTNYVVSSIKDNAKTYYLFAFSIGKESNRNYINIESLNTGYLTIADAENEMSTTEKQQLKVVALPKQEIDRIKKSRELLTMTPNDFKSFAAKIIESDALNRNYLTKKYKLSYLYSESTARIFLSEIGFNSLVKGHVFDEMMGTFLENAETKDIFIKMSGGK